MSSAKWRPFYYHLNVLMTTHIDETVVHDRLTLSSETTITHHLAWCCKQNETCMVSIMTLCVYPVYKRPDSHVTLNSEGGF